MHTPESLAPDNTGGVTLHRLTSTEERLGHRRLQALDLHYAPNLEVLAFTRKKNDKALHLLLNQIPVLRQLSLPPCPQGAVVHLTGDSINHGLHITGPVSQIDAQWGSTQFYLDQPAGGAPWPEIQLVRPADVASLPPGEGLVIIIGDAGDNTRTLTLDGDYHWLVVQCHSLQHLQISTSGQVNILNAERLSTINGSAPALHLSVDNAPALKRVSGTGHRINLRQEKGSVRIFTIDGQWQEAQIRSAQLEELRFPNAKRLELFQCDRLKSVSLPLGVETECHGNVPDSLLSSARLFMDESTLRRHLEAVHNGDHSNLHALLHVLAHRHHSQEAVTALQALSELCQAGAPAEAIWETRQELLARHQRGPNRKRSRPVTMAERHRATTNWRWSLPGDLEQEGLRADIRIWRYCRVHHLPANRYSPVIAKECPSISALHALVVNGMDAGAEPIDQDIMTNALKAWAKPSTRPVLARDHTGTDLGRRLVSIVGSGDVPDNTRDAMLDLLVEGLDADALLAAFQQLLTRQPTRTRLRALKIANAGRPWFRRFGIGFQSDDPRAEQLRGRFLRLSLMAIPGEPPRKAPPHTQTTGDRL